MDVITLDRSPSIALKPGRRSLCDTNNIGLANSSVVLLAVFGGVTL